MNDGFSWEAFERLPVIGILRNIAPEHVDMLASRFHEAGLTCLEITMNSSLAAETISLLSGMYPGRLNIGAGTVCTLHDLEKALSAGAQFIVTPILDEDIIRTCLNKNIPVFPGAYTPTEIYRASALGASMVKVFPATRLGPEYIKEVLAPLNHLKLVPTGGVSADNFTAFLQAGAKGVGAGSSLFPPALIDRGEWDELSKLFSLFVERYLTFKGARNTGDVKH